MPVSEKERLVVRGWDCCRPWTMEDGVGGEAAFRCFHGAVSGLAADVAAPKRELAVLDRSLLTRHAGPRPGVVPNGGDNAEAFGGGLSASSRQRMGVHSAHCGGSFDGRW